MRPNNALHPTPLRGPKIAGVLQSQFVLIAVPIYAAARLNASRWATAGNICTIRYARWSSSKMVQSQKTAAQHHSVPGSIMSNQFLTYLTGAPWQTLPQGYNEPIIHLYRELKFAVREQCDALVFTSTEIVSRRQGQRIHAFSIEGVQPDLGWRGYFDLIRTRDQYIGEHVHLIAETPDEVTYEITP
jgi:hypothetical protein